MIKRFSLLAGALLVLSGVAAAEPVTVPGFEVKTFLNGRTANCVKTKDNSTCDTYFAEDGSVKRYTFDDQKLRKGKWWVDDKGLLNVQWTGKKRPLKFSVVDPGTGSWELRKKKKLKALITGATPGDHIKN